MATTTTPFHRGELEIQRRAGVDEEARRVGRIVARSIPPEAAGLLRSQRVAVTASLDARGRVWASLLAGPPGFIRAVDETLLFVAAELSPDDPLWTNLRLRPELGLVTIDLERRRRLRFNGRGLAGPEGGLFLAVEQVYGNCPKYIQARRITGGTAAAGSRPRTERASRLDGARRRLIAGADTFFIASFHPEGGADASHRGGRPGFVRVEGDDRLQFPDYPGNNMFNTLGNVAEYPQVGLLFVDLQGGDLLQIAGRAELIRDPEVVASHRGARGVVVEVRIEELLHTTGSSLRGTLLEPSSFNP